MARVAIVTDSTADLPPAVAAAHGIRVVPLFVRFGDAEFRAGVDLSTDEFWARMLAPDAPFPTTAAAAPGTFRETFEACFADGAEAVVCITIGSKLSATFKSADLGAGMLPDREIHVVDSTTASMGTGLLVLLAAEMAEAGLPSGGDRRDACAPGSPTSTSTSSWTPSSTCARAAGSRRPGRRSGPSSRSSRSSPSGAGWWS